MGLRRVFFPVVCVLACGPAGVGPGRAAPVPRAAATPPVGPAASSPSPSLPSVGPVVPGFRWRYGGRTYEVVAVDGIYARYVCVCTPDLVHPGLDGSDERNTQSVGRVMWEALGLTYPGRCGP